MLYSFGLNSFGQTIPRIGDDPDCGEQVMPVSVTSVLYSVWESTFGFNDNGELVVWGFDPQSKSKSRGVVPFNWFKSMNVAKVYGDPNSVLGILDVEGNVYHYDGSGTSKPILVAEECKDVACMTGSKTVLLVKKDGKVYHVALKIQDKYDLLPIQMPTVQCVRTSQYHAIFCCQNPFALYGIGSNRFAQLGTPDTSYPPLVPQRISFFDGLNPGQVQVSCGAFHSSFVLDGDLYTCGLSTDGRLGSGAEQEHDGYPRLAIFQTSDGMSCEVNVVKAVCGAAHTIAIDDQGRAWGCGSNKYGQVPIKTNHDQTKQESACYYFQLLSIEYASGVTECWAGRWSTFLQIKT